MKSNFAENQILSTNELKQIFGGEGDVLSKCSVTCDSGEVKSKDCGQGVSCTTSATKIYCGNDGGTEMCGQEL